MAKYRLVVPSREEFEDWKREWKATEQSLPEAESRLFREETSLEHALRTRLWITGRKVLGTYGSANPQDLVAKDKSHCPRSEDFGDYLSFHDNLGWMEYRAFTTHLYRCWPCANSLMIICDSIIDDSTRQLGSDRSERVFHAVESEYLAAYQKYQHRYPSSSSKHRSAILGYLNEKRPSRGT